MFPVYPITIADILGWPMLIVSFVFTFLGILKNNSTFSIFGVIFTAPLILYLFASPKFYFGLIPVISQIGVLLSKKNSSYRLAYMFSLIYLSFILGIGYLAIRSG